MTFQPGMTETHCGGYPTQLTAAADTEKVSLEALSLGLRQATQYEACWWSVGIDSDEWFDGAEI